MSYAPKDPKLRAAEVLIEYAAMIEEGEIHRSGPLKGKCEPEIQEEIDEYRALAAALAQPDVLQMEPTPEMIAAVGTILQPYAARAVWERMALAAKEPPPPPAVKPASAQPIPWPFPSGRRP